MGRAKTTFGHVVAVVLTVRSSGDELDVLRPGVVPDTDGLVLDEATGWADGAELGTESSRLLAPRRLGQSLA